MVFEETAHPALFETLWWVDLGTCIYGTYSWGVTSSLHDIIWCPLEFFLEAKQSRVSKRWRLEVGQFIVQDAAAVILLLAITFWRRFSCIVFRYMHAVVSQSNSSTARLPDCCAHLVHLIRRIAFRERAAAKTQQACCSCGENGSPLTLGDGVSSRLRASVFALLRR